MTHTVPICRLHREAQVPLEPVRAFVAISVSSDQLLKHCQVYVAWESVGTEEDVRAFIAEWMDETADPVYVVELNAVLGPVVAAAWPIDEDSGEQQDDDMPLFGANA